MSLKIKKKHTLIKPPPDWIFLQGEPFFCLITTVLSWNSDEIEKKPYSIVAFVLQFGQVYNNNVIVSVVKRNIHFPRGSGGFSCIVVGYFHFIVPPSFKGFRENRVKLWSRAIAWRIVRGVHHQEGLHLHCLAL